PPPWRHFDSGEDPPYAVPALEGKQRKRGGVFRLPRQGDGSLTDEAEAVRLAVNAAILLRRPLLITGTPGCGKTSLAYAIAHELDLGRVLCWPITPRAEMRDGLYRYEALDRLRDAQRGGTESAADFITLGPLGTAFLPFASPRVLLIDELDKADLQLPNELLHLFEEGSYEIPQLRREARPVSEGAGDDPQAKVEASPVALVDTDDPGCRAPIRAGRVQCHAFPIVVMTSNREREFPPAFHRRCIRVEMPTPSQRDTLLDVARQHFAAREEGNEKEGNEEKGNPLDEQAALERIDSFLGEEGRLDRATDQLLNALHLLCGPERQRPGEKQMKALEAILFKRLSDGG
ncbi:MAG: AAA family ATPase, partial [Cyanobacteriota bacterium]|nr:AAA family ATPase [Cyanobacteriota bacterium]